MDPPSAIPPKETKTAKATQFHVTSIADVCMVFPSGIRIFANVSVLRNASPVFRAMLGPQFQEGQAIINNTGSTQDIAFPEDDSDAMLTLARLLHHREIELSNKLKAKHVYEVAVLADKYDVCQVAKSALATLPIQRDNWKNMCSNMWYLLTAAFIVGHRCVFKKMSTELLWDFANPYITLVRACKTRGEADIWIVILLEEKRAMLRRTMFEDIFYYFSYAPRKVSKTELRSHYGRIASSVSFERHETLRTNIESLQSAMENDSGASNDKLKNLESMVEEVESQISTGICFDCVGNYGSHTKQHDSTELNSFF